MDIAEILAETEQLKKKHLETAQKLAEAKTLLAKLNSAIMIFADKYQDTGLYSFTLDIEEFLQ